MSQSSGQTPNPNSNPNNQLQSLTAQVNDTSTPIHQASSLDVTETLEDTKKSHRQWREWKITLLKYDEQKRRQPTIMGHFLIFFSLLAIIIGAYFLKERTAIYRADNWLSDWESYDKDSLNYSTQTFQSSDNPSKITPAELQRIDQQLQEIHVRIKVHEEIMKSFYRRYYTTTSLATGAAIVAGICLFVITREGWQQANKGWVNIFLVASTSALLFREVPRIFKYEENFGNNFHQYREYVALRNKIYSFLATGTVITETAKITQQFNRPNPNQFILSVDQQLTQLHDIHVGFNRARLDALGSSPILDIPEESLDRE